MGKSGWEMGAKMVKTIKDSVKREGVYSAVFIVAGIRGKGDGASLLSSTILEVSIQNITDGVS